MLKVMYECTYSLQLQSFHFFCSVEFFAVVLSSLSTHQLTNFARLPMPVPGKNGLSSLTVSYTLSLIAAMHS